MCWLKNKLIAKIVIWLVAEIVLNFLGIDDLADYSEFVFENNSDNCTQFTVKKDSYVYPKLFSPKVFFSIH